MSVENEVAKLYEGLSSDFGFDLIDRIPKTFVSKWTTLIFHRNKDRNLPELKLQLSFQSERGYIVAVNSNPRNELLPFP